MGRVQFAPVAQGLSDFEAKVVTARLGADGILWEIRGIVDSLYPLGGIDVLVPVDELDAARASLRHAAPLPAPADDGRWPPDGREIDPDDGTAVAAARGRRRWVTVVVVAGVAAFALARLATTLIVYDAGTDCGGGSFRAATEGLTVRCRP